MMKVPPHVSRLIDRRQMFTGGLALSLLPALARANGEKPEAAKDTRRLSFRKPATHMMEALPVGNGRLGAMVYGGVASERLQLNHIELWAGRTVDDNPRGVPDVLPEIRRLLFAGQRAEAEKLAQSRIMPAMNSEDFGTYQMLGNLTLNFDHGDVATDYVRHLDMSDAMAVTEYTIDGARYRRSVIASFPDKALLIRLETTAKAGLDATLTLSRAQDAQVSHQGDRLQMLGEPQPFGVTFAACLGCETEGGTVQPIGGGYRITGARSVLIRITCETDLFQPDSAGRALAALTAVRSKSWQQSVKAQRTDHKSLFDRIDLSLEPARPSGDTSIDTMLVESYFNFGRYLFISSCRPGSLPPNLQGLWCDGFAPPWQCDYHVNINLQMNFWPAEVCGLGDLHQSLFDYAQRLRPFGEKTARTVYDCNGMVAHYTTNPWGHTAQDGNTQYGLWPEGLAWLSLHFWEHYLFTHDRKFLADQAYPFLRSAADFTLDYLVESPLTGKLVAGPAVSPENGYRLADGTVAYVDMGCTMSQSMAFTVLTHASEAAQALSVDSDFITRCQAAIARLDRMKIGADGRVLEWSEPLAEGEPGHRHISHLFGLYPGIEIDPVRTPDLAAAARKTIEARLQHGGGQTGWSAAWLIMYRARLADAPEAYAMLNKLLTHSTAPNLFDIYAGSDDPIFQIDGNLGATAAIVEMLVQSHDGQLRLLPALPDSWASGRIRGVRARGGLELDMQWRNGVVTALTLRPTRDQVVKLVLPNGQLPGSLKSSGDSVPVNGQMTLRAGRIYRL
ncbi:MAG: glycoside hydrolase family 95 protein [Asticcacaulis sp.]|uniref:glycoside hydrolase family 95 protein n=1 Tax=Asticcacaulis sp. TaxID=1872648 RepID=UPI0039E36BE6